jgi:hypothetical protein
MAKKSAKKVAKPVMAKKAAKPAQKTAEPTAATPETVKASGRESAPPAKSVTDGDGPKDHLIRIWNEGDIVTDAWHGAPRDLEVTIGGKPYTHCNTDADGIWIYRNDRKN